jgi:hypothetical protein
VKLQGYTNSDWAGNSVLKTGKPEAEPIGFSG